MSKLTKLSAVGDSFTVHMYDNGFVVQVSGRNRHDNWGTAKIVCNTIDEVVDIFKEIQMMERA